MAGDGCRSCGELIILNKKFLKKFDALDQKLRAEQGFVRACEACSTSGKALKCVRNKCAAGEP